MASPRIALITGGNRGIGLAIASNLVDLGYGVALTARSEGALAAAKETLVGRGATTVVTVAADLRDPAATQRVVEAVSEQAGPIDALINNAGTAPSGRIEDTPDEILDEVLDLHVRAPFRLIRSVLPGMKERGHGLIVQIASTAGLRGFALISAYTAAKHGMVGLTRALAVELQHTPIRVHAVCPGFVDTDLTRAGAAKVAGMGGKSEAEIMQAYGRLNRCGRLLRPEEVAAVVAELAHPESEISSGSIYVLDDMPPTLQEGNPR